MNIKARVSKLEQGAMPPAFPLLMSEAAPNLLERIAKATKQGRKVLLLSEIDERL